ncbi:hypothetical protein QL285_085036 [Trifolium repens]|nr:hypothetical protein QL285_085036 [Trifolium repens]
MVPLRQINLTKLTKRELGQQPGGFKAQHTWAWPINILFLFSEKTIESKNRKKGKTFLRLSLCSSDQSTTTTHRKARPNHSLATHRGRRSPPFLCLFLTPNLLPFSAQFQVIVFDFRLIVSDGARFVH